MSEINLNGVTPQEETTPAPEGDQFTPEVGESEQEPNERTFTQDEINKIISRRVAEERSKADALLKQREAEIVQREYEYHVQTTLKDKRLSPQLADILKGGDKATFDKSLAAYEKALQAGIMERLRGSAPPASRGSASLGDTIRSAMGLKRE